MRAVAAGCGAAGCGLPAAGIRQTGGAGLRTIGIHMPACSSLVTFSEISTSLVRFQYPLLLSHLEVVRQLALLELLLQVFDVRREIYHDVSVGSAGRPLLLKTFVNPLLNLRVIEKCSCRYAGALRRTVSGTKLES